MQFHTISGVLLMVMLWSHAIGVVADAKTPADETFAEKDVIDKGVVVETLNPKSKSATTRGIVMDKPKGFNISVKFKGKSDKILPKSYAQLDAMAEAVKMAGVKVVIEAHEPKGSANTATALSKKRAEAVKSLFMERQGISKDLLVAEGKGSEEPLNPEEPKAAENRRICIRRATDSTLASGGL